MGRCWEEERKGKLWLGCIENNNKKFKKYKRNKEKERKSQLGFISSLEIDRSSS